MKKNIIAVYIILLLIINCSNIPKEKVDLFANNYLALIKEHKYDQTLIYYSNKFAAKHKPVDVFLLYKYIESKLGAIISFKQLSSGIQRTFGTDESGTTYYLEYEVKYTKYDATAEIEVFIPDSTLSPKIQSYIVKSKGLSATDRPDQL